MHLLVVAISWYWHSTNCTTIINSNIYSSVFDVVCVSKRIFLHFCCDVFYVKTFYELSFLFILESNIILIYTSLNDSFSLSLVTSWHSASMISFHFFFLVLFYLFFLWKRITQHAYWFHFDPNKNGKLSIHFHWFSTDFFGYEKKRKKNSISTFRVSSSFSFFSFFYEITERLFPNRIEKIKS